MIEILRGRHKSVPAILGIRNCCMRANDIDPTSATIRHFMQDGAPPHYAPNVLEFQDVRRSYPCDFFLSFYNYYEYSSRRNSKTSANSLNCFSRHALQLRASAVVVLGLDMLLAIRHALLEVTVDNLTSASINEDFTKCGGIKVSRFYLNNRLTGRLQELRIMKEKLNLFNDLAKMDPQYKEQSKQIQKQYCSKLSESKRNMNDEILAHSSNKSKSMWNIINQLKGKKKNKKEIKISNELQKGRTELKGGENNVPHDNRDFNDGVSIDCVKIREEQEFVYKNDNKATDVVLTLENMKACTPMRLCREDLIRNSKKRIHCYKKVICARKVTEYVTSMSVESP
ncbi:unnamed protein product [Callosobruchus maculatus]|uniref:Uncharacterized protein n=1 Tax=Callosobruchus maculatus TaxID=64391 RepID=A0A653CNQ1_CALMS|nr:unnamed protein product [Callosobruchus maculatus]